MLKSWVKLYHRPLRKQTSTRKTITNKGTRLYKNQSRTKEEIKKKKRKKKKVGGHSKRRNFRKEAR